MAAKRVFAISRQPDGFPVQPVHQPRLLALGVAHHFQHVVDISRDAGAALHGEARGLVQHHDIGVLIEDHVLEGLQRLGRGFRELARALRRIELERRNANALPLLDPVLAVGALAVDAQLAFANDALDVGERQARKARLEETVDAHVVLVGGDDDGLDLGRQRRRLGHNLLRLRHKRLCRTRRRGRKPRRRLAARTIRLRPLGWRAPIGTRALRAIARRAERSFDASAHAVFPSFRDVGRMVRRGNTAIFAPIWFSARRSS